MARPVVAALALAALLGSGACAADEDPSGEGADWAAEAEQDSVRVDLQDESGAGVGSLVLSETINGTRVMLDAELPIGDHPMLLQQSGSCDAAGSGQAEEFGRVEVTDDGSATADFVVRQFSLSDLTDSDGSVILIGDDVPAACGVVEPAQ